MRDRLIELLEEAKTKAQITIGSLNNGWGAWYADYLIANGVFVPPCKVGDVVYKVHAEYSPFISTHTVEQYGVPYKNVFGAYDIIPFEAFGKRVFLTREEAERASQEKEGV